MRMEIKKGLHFGFKSTIYAVAEFNSYSAFQILVSPIRVIAISVPLLEPHPLLGVLYESQYELPRMKALKEISII